MSSFRVIAAEDNRRCATCGAIAETRPYGPGYSEICHPCSRKDESTIKAVEARMGDVLFDGVVKPKRGLLIGSN